MLEITYFGKELNGLESGEVIRGWDKWVAVRYNVLRKYNPNLPEYPKFDPYDRGLLDEYSNAIRGDIGRELERFRERAVYCECEIGKKVMEAETMKTAI